MIFELNHPVGVEDLGRLMSLMPTSAVGKAAQKDARIHAVSALDTAQHGHLTFAKNQEQALQSKAWVIGPGSDHQGFQSTHPRFSFMKTLQHLQVEVGFRSPQGASQVADTAIIGPYVVLEEGVIIGEHVRIDAHTIIRKGTVIGDHSVIGPNCTIGHDGFGYERDEQGRPVKFPHLGDVHIGEHVEIGANTCIDRGTLQHTVICDRVKIDNLVHIAHNCHIGADSFVIAGAEVSGSVRVGERSWIAPQACIREKLTIGDDATVGLGAVVVKNVQDRSIVLGNPAKPRG